MKTTVITVVICILVIIMISACRKKPQDGSGGSAIGRLSSGRKTETEAMTETETGAGNQTEAVPKGDSPYGTWYEQSEFGGVLEVTETTIRYTAYEERYVSESDLSVVRDGTDFLLETDEDDYFAFVDMRYDRFDDQILVHDWPHTDGDGGYHLIVFARSPYEAPPAPVYDPPEDLSDPDAKKVFEDLTIRSMKVSFYDPGVYHDPNSDMAPEPPYEGRYEYDLTVLEDGTALVSSSFCQEIELSAEVVTQLQDLVNASDLGAINGLDIHTPGVPEDAADYTLELELAGGEVIRSSANWDNVPENWTAFQEPMHHLLFFAFVDAGYHYNGGEFHSTRPMKRLGTDIMLTDPDTPGRQKLKVSYDSVRVEPDWEKPYDYDLHTEYFVFNGTDPERPELFKTLKQLEAQYQSAAEASIQADYETMNAVPKTVWKKADRRYCYSFYTVAYDKDHGLFYSFLISEGHANSLGAGDYGYGYYPNLQYNIDVETGQILSAADIFTDSETACRIIVESLRDAYGTYREVGKFIHSDAFEEALKDYIDLPGPEGISWDAGYDGVTLTFPASLFPMEEDYSPMHTLYYDELQDVLSDRYSSVW